MPPDPEILEVSLEEYVRKTTSSTLYLPLILFLYLNQALSYPLRPPFCLLLAYACVCVWVSVGVLAKSVENKSGEIRITGSEG